MNSCFYECHIIHERFLPQAHRFLYRIFLFALDLDELDRLHRSLRLFSFNRPNLYSFRERDFLPTGEALHNGPLPENHTPAAGLKTRVIGFLASRGVDLTGGRVLLVTLPRVFGYLFNPVSFYFCYDRTGAPVAALSEVTNTFKEMKPYYLGPETSAAAAFRLRIPKDFYVSPYSDVDVAFDFTLRPPTERLAIQIDDYTGRTRSLTTSLTGSRQPLTDARLAWFTLKYPLITLRIIGLIHWHALLLWMKKIPWFAKAARPADQRALYRPHRQRPQIMSTDTTRTIPLPSVLDRKAPTFAEKAVFSSLADMQQGRLRLELPDGSVREFGDPAAIARDLVPGIGNIAQIRVRRAVFFRKCVLGGDIGFAESFIDGDWETPDLTAVISWFILNVEYAPTLTGSKRARLLAANLLRSLNRLGHLLRPNSRTIARQNIREHYDLSNDFFALWLDPTMMYSGARWERADASLQEAQFAKNDMLCRKLRLKPTDHVLEIGTGWGGWSLHAARHHGCRVTTLTISQQQLDLARKRIAAAGLRDRIEVRLQDYRDITGQFDKIVSIEMLEAVGHRYLPDYAAACHRLLKRDGLLALQFITYPDSRYAQLRRGVDFIQKHIFPGSLLLSVNRLNQLLSEKCGFILHSLEDGGRDYVRTLRTWRQSFHQKTDQVRALGFDDRFIRKWDYYLCYCEAAFALRNISVVQTVHTRPNNFGL